MTQETSVLVGGTVEWFNVVNGYGMISVDDGSPPYFVHEKSIRDMSGIRFLLPGWPVRFVPFKRDGKNNAAEVIVLEETGVQRVTPDARGFSETNSEMPLIVDSLGRVRVGENVLTPTTQAKGTRGRYSTVFRAYYVGANRFQGFNLTLPESNALTAFILLDQHKNPRRLNSDRRYSGVYVGSYLMKVESSGQVTIWRLGVRCQGTNQYWVVIERHLRCRYDLSSPSEEAILAQIPTSGFKFDNHQFVTGILKGIQLMREKQSVAA